MAHPFETYCQLSKELAHLYSASALLYWDFETQMPKGGQAWRSEDFSFFAGLIHDRISQPLYLESAALALEQTQDPKLRAALGRAVKEIKKATLVPKGLVQEMAIAQTHSHQAWQEAKKENNFSIFAPHLERIIELTKSIGEFTRQDLSTYDAMLDEYSPGQSTETLKDVFKPLKSELKKILSQRKPERSFSWSVPEAIQKQICQDAAQWMNFPSEHLTLQKSVHPFCTSMHPSDVRITTRYDESEPLMSLMSTVHELGHALYEHQLPTQFMGTPFSRAQGMDLHESQSRLWEVCIASSRPFLQWVWSWYQKNAPQFLNSLTPDDLFELATPVRPSLIRTEADPISYGLHIMIRFELEQAIFNHQLSIKDLPEAWNQAYTENLGLRPQTLAQGILQDSHWPNGAFGYFPSYLLGTMMACQFYQTLEQRFTDLDTRISEGQFTDIHIWLKENIHQHGQSLSSQEILKQSTGQTLNSKPFLQFLAQRFNHRLLL